MFCKSNWKYGCSPIPEEPRKRKTIGWSSSAHPISLLRIAADAAAMGPSCPTICSFKRFSRGKRRLSSSCSFFFRTLYYKKYIKNSAGAGKTWYCMRQQWGERLGDTKTKQQTFYMGGGGVVGLSSFNFFPLYHLPSLMPLMQPMNASTSCLHHVVTWLTNMSHAHLKSSNCFLLHNFYTRLSFQVLPLIVHTHATHILLCALSPPPPHRHHAHYTYNKLNLYLTSSYKTKCSEHTITYYMPFK